LQALTAHAIQIGAGTSALVQVGPDASTHKYLKSAGASADPVFATIDLTADVGSSITPAANGGTNATAIGSAGSIPYSSSGTTYGAVPTFLGGEAHFRRAIADAAATVATTDFIVAYTSITATRVATLPNATTGAGVQFFVGDESGSVSSTIMITVKSSGGTLD